MHLQHSEIFSLVLLALVLAIALWSFVQNYRRPSQRNWRQWGAMVFMAFLVSGCSTDAAIASRNLSTAADQFQIERRIVFYDAIQGTYLLSIEGRCSIQKDNRDDQLEVTCKTSESDYKKHFLGISDNVTYFAEQLSNAQVSVYHYKVIFRPQVIIPDIDLKIGVDS